MIRKLNNRRIFIAVLLSVLLFGMGLACSAVDPIGEASVETAIPTVLAVTTELCFSPSPETTASPTPTPVPTPVPTPIVATIGAVGDIMIPSAYISDAKQEDGTYDFLPQFAAWRELFSEPDFFCANLETPLGGERYPYSGKQNPETGLYEFNAPDILAAQLKELGIDLLTTGNNHCLDCGAEGLYRTVSVLREQGFVQLGTYLDETDRSELCIVDINGIRVGFVSATMYINSRTSHMLTDEALVAINQLMQNGEIAPSVLDEIRALRTAGAEYIIVFPHWDTSDIQTEPTERVRSFADAMLKAGADLILGSHPHQIRVAEYRTVEREDGTTYTGPVLYSLGNFSCNTSFYCSVGLYVRLTLEKDLVTDTVTLKQMQYLPSLSYRGNREEGQNCSVLPVFADPSRIDSRYPFLSRECCEELYAAREQARSILGADTFLTLLDGDGAVTIPPMETPTP